jgi:hypothetical protein
MFGVSISLPKLAISDQPMSSTMTNKKLGDLLCAAVEILSKNNTADTTIKRLELLIIVFTFLEL